MGSLKLKSKGDFWFSSAEVFKWFFCLCLSVLTPLARLSHIFPSTYARKGLPDFAVARVPAYVLERNVYWSHVCALLVPNDLRRIDQSSGGKDCPYPVSIRCSPSWMAALAEWNAVRRTISRRKSGSSLEKKKGRVVYTWGEKHAHSWALDERKLRADSQGARKSGPYFKHLGCYQQGVIGLYKSYLNFHVQTNHQELKMIYP